MVRPQQKTCLMKPHSSLFPGLIHCIRNSWILFDSVYVTTHLLLVVCLCVLSLANSSFPTAWQRIKYCSYIPHCKFAKRFTVESWPVCRGGGGRMGRFKKNFFAECWQRKRVARFLGVKKIRKTIMLVQNTGWRTAQIHNFIEIADNSFKTFLQF